MKISKIFPALFALALFAGATLAQSGAGFVSKVGISLGSGQYRER
jgi:hypothetical protein